MVDKKDKKPRRVGKRAAAKAKEDGEVQDIVQKTEKVQIDNNRSSSGVLTSEKNSRDIKVFFYS
jgi:ATP-binding cassette, subfamily F, member 2